MIDASRFVSNRKHTITGNKIKNIFWYIGECYLLMINDKAQYSKSYVQNSTTIKFEDYLKFRLIEDYLVKNKKLLKSRVSGLEEINFLAETQKEFKDTNDYKLKPDKIDIFINRLGLTDTWGEYEEKIYFAIECKRICKLSDVNDYFTDIKKFANRDYPELRLPFEGQLAFVENSSVTHSDIASTINTKLQQDKEIKTDAFLENCCLNQSVAGSYHSKHKRNIKSLAPFYIYHMFLDYSNIVID